MNSYMVIDKNTLYNLLEEHMLENDTFCYLTGYFYQFRTYDSFKVLDYSKKFDYVVVRMNGHNEVLNFNDLDDGDSLNFELEVEN